MLDSVGILRIVRGICRVVTKADSGRVEDLPRGILPDLVSCKLAAVELAYVQSDPIDGVWKSNIADDRINDGQPHSEVDYLVEGWPCLRQLRCGLRPGRPRDIYSGYLTGLPPFGILSFQSPTLPSIGRAKPAPTRRPSTQLVHP